MPVRAVDVGMQPVNHLPALSTSGRHGRSQCAEIDKRKETNFASLFTKERQTFMAHPAVTAYPDARSGKSSGVEELARFTNFDGIATA